MCSFLKTQPIYAEPSNWSSNSLYSSPNESRYCIGLATLNRNHSWQPCLFKRSDIKRPDGIRRRKAPPYTCQEVWLSRYAHAQRYRVLIKRAKTYMGAKYLVNETALREPAAMTDKKAAQLFMHPVLAAQIVTRATEDIENSVVEVTPMLTNISCSGHWSRPLSRCPTQRARWSANWPISLSWRNQKLRQQLKLAQRNGPVQYSCISQKLSSSPLRTHYKRVIRARIMASKLLCSTSSGPNWSWPYSIRDSDAWSSPK